MRPNNLFKTLLPNVVHCCGQKLGTFSFASGTSVRTRTGCNGYHETVKEM